MQESVIKLLQAHSAIMDKLRKTGVIRTGNNPVSGYAEWLVQEKLKCTLAVNSMRGSDACDAKGVRYQVKCRRVTKANPSMQLGVIRDLDKSQFDFLIAIYFNEDYTIDRVFQVPHGVIKNYAKPSKHQNGHILHIKGKILDDKRVRDITDKFMDGKN